MVYVDTSVLVALFSKEATAVRIAQWYGDETRPLASGDWCVTEFASALAIKERTAQLTRKQSNAAWKLFAEFCGNGLRLLPLDREVFSRATHLVRGSKNALRAGDALHLALALQVQATAFFTLDTRLEASARVCELPVIALP